MRSAVVPAVLILLSTARASVPFDTFQFPASSNSYQSSYDNDYTLQLPAAAKDNALTSPAIQSSHEPATNSRMVHLRRMFFGKKYARQDDDEEVNGDGSVQPSQDKSAIPSPIQAISQEAHARSAISPMLGTPDDSKFDMIMRKRGEDCSEPERKHADQGAGKPGQNYGHAESAHHAEDRPPTHVGIPAQHQRHSPDSHIGILSPQTDDSSQTQASIRTSHADPGMINLGFGLGNMAHDAAHTTHSSKAPPDVKTVHLPPIVSELEDPSTSTHDHSFHADILTDSVTHNVDVVSNPSHKALLDYGSDSQTSKDLLHEAGSGFVPNIRMHGHSNKAGQTKVPLPLSVEPCNNPDNYKQVELDHHDSGHHDSFGYPNSVGGFDAEIKLKIKDCGCPAGYMPRSVLKLMEHSEL